MKYCILGIFIILTIPPLLAQEGTTGFLKGLTIGPLPFLEYGLGDDRLGGAKMTFLDTNIVIKIVDSVKDDYKVHLSNYHYGWLAKTSFQRDDTIHIQPYYLTSSWKV